MLSEQSTTRHMVVHNSSISDIYQCRLWFCTMMSLEPVVPLESCDQLNTNFSLASLIFILLISASFPQELARCIKKACSILPALFLK